MGVLEDALGATGDGLASAGCDKPAWGGFHHARHDEDALSAKEAELAMRAARWRIGRSASRRAILRARIKSWDGVKKAHR